LDFLLKCDDLHSLDLSYNYISFIDRQQLARLHSILPKCNNLTSLNLAASYEPKSCLEFYRLCNALINCKLESLNLSYNEIGKSDIKFIAFCNMLNYCKSLQELVITNNSFDAVSQQKYMGFLYSLQAANIAKLDISGNGVNSSQEYAIKKILFNNIFKKNSLATKNDYGNYKLTTLTAFYMQQNNILPIADSIPQDLNDKLSRLERCLLP
jgi:Ran GTPase-activating protein (RanGAP) involved in mRNA processing and transport